MAKETIAVSVETELIAQARAAATADSRNLSNWVELAIREKLQRMAKE